jgi:hypothetical protein
VDIDKKNRVSGVLKEYYKKNVSKKVILDKKKNSQTYTNGNMGG